MQIESLKVFCDLAETKSFTKAAQINSVTQSAVSQTVSTLEQRFQSPFIERSKKNFRLTPEGEVFYEYSKRILQTCDALRSKLQEIENVISGDVRVATIYSIGLHVLPPYVKRFMQSYPSVKVHVEYRSDAQVYENLLGNVVDLGLVAYPARDSRIVVVPIRKDTLVLICHPQHPLAEQKSVRVKALQGQKFVNFARDIPTRRALDNIFKEHRVTVEQVMQFDNVETVKRAVEINSGVAIVPRETVANEVSTGALVAIRLENGAYCRPLAVIHKKDRVLSPAIKKFIALLKGPA